MKLPFSLFSRKPPLVSWFERDEAPAPPQTVALRLRPGAVVSNRVYKSLNTVMLSHPGDQLILKAGPAVRFHAVTWRGYEGVPPGMHVEVGDDRIVIRADEIPARADRHEYLLALSVGDKAITLDPIVDRDVGGGGPSTVRLN